LTSGLVPKPGNGPRCFCVPRREASFPGPTLFPLDFTLPAGGIRRPELPDHLATSCRNREGYKTSPPRSSHSLIQHDALAPSVFMTQCQFLPSNHVNRVRVRAPFDGTARLDGYGIAVASTARRDGSLVRRMRRVPRAKTRQAGGDGTFDGDRRWNPFKIRLCLL
jgi:hypothetical protein